MQNKIKKLQKLIQSSGSIEGSQQEIVDALTTIKQTLLLSLLKDELAGLFNDLQEDEQQEPGKTEEFDLLDELKNITTTKIEENTTYYLLHRPTDDFEYQNSQIDEDQFKTPKETMWYADYMKGERQQKGENPLVSCWVPGSHIISTPTPHDNTGTWGDLGENPFADDFVVKVKPGQFKIYQELRQ